MPAYELTQAADADLQEIARYLVEKWGAAHAERYGALLEKHFEALAKKPDRGRIFFSHRPELRVARCEHHYVFYLLRAKQSPLILAVLHEHMDLIQRLRDRLGG